MRTTLTLDDDLARKLKQRALDSGRSFKEVVNEALRSGLEQSTGDPARRAYRLKPASMGKASPGFDLDRALNLAARLEDEELARKLDLRK